MSVIYQQYGCVDSVSHYGIGSRTWLTVHTLSSSRDGFRDNCPKLRYPQPHRRQTPGTRFPPQNHGGIFRPRQPPCTCVGWVVSGFGVVEVWVRFGVGWGWPKYQSNRLPSTIFSSLRQVLCGALFALSPCLPTRLPLLCLQAAFHFRG